MIIWKPLVGECFKCMKGPTNKVDKNAVAVVDTNSHRNEEEFGHVQQKPPWLYRCFYPYLCILGVFAAWKLVSHREK